jgi:hypothetical protein
MKCPKCGYMRQTRDDAFVPATECPSCGIVYAKHDTIASPEKATSSATAHPHLRPSAVDPESLKKARERVEKRLRERMEVRERDDRYEQTLELAKKITEENNNPGQDPLLQALGKRLETMPMDPSDDPAVITADPVLLEEMVGVRIHDGKDGTASSDREEKESPEGQPQADADTSAEAQKEPTPGTGSAEAQEEKTNAVEAESGGKETDPHEADTDTAEAHAPEPEPAETEDPAYPDDVQVETILLKSQVENTASPLAENEETEQPAAEVCSDDRDEDPLEDCIAAASTATRFGWNLTRLLPMVAWLILITGLVGAVLSWTTISDVEAGVNMTVGTGSSPQLPLGLLLGFAYLATGALGFAFFWVSSVINRHLKDIRQMLMVHQNASASES